MNIELTAKQRAQFVADLLNESTTEELETLTCRFIRAYSKFQHADMGNIQRWVDRYTKLKVDERCLRDDEWDGI